MEAQSIQGAQRSVSLLSVPLLGPRRAPLGLVCSNVLRLPAPSSHTVLGSVRTDGPMVGGATARSGVEGAQLTSRPLESGQYDRRSSSAGLSA